MFPIAFFDHEEDIKHSAVAETFMASRRHYFVAKLFPVKNKLLFSTWKNVSRVQTAVRGYGH